MTIDNRSSNQNYKLPNPQNLLADDAQRLIDAINAIDADVNDRYTKAEVDQAIADLIDGSPETLNTLNEIAQAISDDSSYFQTVNNALATKANLSGGNTFSGEQKITGDVVIEKDDAALKLEHTSNTTYGRGNVFTGIEFQVNDTDGATGATAPYSHAYIRAEHARSGSGHNNPDAGLVFGASQGTNPIATDRAYLDNEGRFGIGTRPASKLHVSGDIRGTGNFIPDTTQTGNVGLSDRKFADGHFHDFQVDNVLNVRGAIDLADNDVLRLGSGDDVQISHNGSHLYIKMLNDDDFVVTDQNSSDRENFRIDTNEGRVYIDDHMYAGRNMTSAPYKSGVHSITCYGRNSSTHESTDWSAYAQMNGDYRGQGNAATNEDTAMFYAIQRDPLAGSIAMHNFDVQGRVWSYGAAYFGRGRSSTTGSASAYYKSGEHIVQVYAGSSGSFTYICGRNVADTSFVYQADVGTPRIEFQADGNGRFDGGADIGSADYAEMFEWADGNPDAEDRRGYAVCLDGEQVRFATSDDAPADIIGIVSAEPGVLGDSASLNWQGMHLKDDYGRKLRNAVEYLVWNNDDDAPPSADDEHDAPAYRVPVAELGTGSALDQTIPDYAREDNIRKTYYELVQNPDYDPEQTYVARRNRKEWDAIGMLGKLALRKGQPVGDRWRKLKDINETLEMWLVR